MNKIPARFELVTCGAEEGELVGVSGSVATLFSSSVASEMSEMSGNLSRVSMEVALVA